MNSAAHQTVSFYSQHPISKDLILSELGLGSGDTRRVAPEELWPHDQDHFGGTSATDTLATEARIGKGTHVVDFCAGLGGTARYLAYRYGCSVTGIELTPARVEGAEELSRLVGLKDVAKVLQGDVTDVPLANDIADVVISQEAFCHVPDLQRALTEAFRLLKPGGRLAFTDWIANAPIGAEDTRLMWEGVAILPLQSISSYRDLVCQAGFRISSFNDLTEEWQPILERRLVMYQKLRDTALNVGAPGGPEAFHRAYIRLIALVQTGVLGGIRLIAVK